MPHLGGGLLLFKGTECHSPSTSTSCEQMSLDRVHYLYSPRAPVLYGTYTDVGLVCVCVLG